MRLIGNYGHHPMIWDYYFYATVLHGLGVVGHLDKARKVFDEMSREGCTPSTATCNTLIQVTCKKGDVEDAVAVFDDMIRKGYIRNVVTYTLLIRGLCHARKIDRAMKLLDKMKREGCDPNVWTYDVLSGIHLRKGRSRECLGFVRDNEQRRGMLA